MNIDKLSFSIPHRQESACINKKQHKSSEKFSSGIAFPSATKALQSVYWSRKRKVSEHRQQRCDVG